MHLIPRPGLVRLTHKDKPGTERYGRADQFETVWAPAGWETPDLPAIQGELDTEPEPAEPEAEEPEKPAKKTRSRAKGNDDESNDDG